MNLSTNRIQQEGLLQLWSAQQQDCPLSLSFLLRASSSLDLLSKEAPEAAYHIKCVFLKTLVCNIRSLWNVTASWSGVLDFRFVFTTQEAINKSWQWKQSLSLGYVTNSHVGKQTSGSCSYLMLSFRFHLAQLNIHLVLYGPKLSFYLFHCCLQLILQFIYQGLTATSVYRCLKGVTHLLATCRCPLSARGTLSQPPRVSLGLFYTMYWVSSSW